VDGTAEVAATTEQVGLGDSEDPAGEAGEAQQEVVEVPGRELGPVLGEETTMGLPGVGGVDRLRVGSSSASARLARVHVGSIVEASRRTPHS